MPALDQRVARRSAPLRLFVEAAKELEVSASPEIGAARMRAPQSSEPKIPNESHLKPPHAPRPDQWPPNTDERSSSWDHLSGIGRILQRGVTMKIVACLGALALGPGGAPSRCPRRLRLHRPRRLWMSRKGKGCIRPTMIGSGSPRLRQLTLSEPTRMFICSRRVGASLGGGFARRGRRR
jgi:hypothetical protein